MSVLTKQIIIYFYGSDGIITGVADNFKGITWERCSSQVGSFRITFDNPSDTLMNIIRSSQFVILNKDMSRAGIIKDINESFTQNLHHVIINGAEIKNIISKRIILDGGEYEDEAPSAVLLDIIKKNCVSGEVSSADRALPFLSVSVAAGTYSEDNIDFSKKYQNVSDASATLAEAHDMVIRATTALDGNGAISDISLMIYPEGTNRSVDQQINDPIILGFRYNTIDDIDVTRSISSTSNYAYVGGQGEGAQRTIEEVGTSSGLSRNEIFVEGRNAEDNELEEKGVEALSKYSDIDCSVITPSEYLARKYFNGDFAPGDILTIDIPRINLMLTKVVEIYEKGYSYLKMELGRNKRTIAGTLDELTYNYNNLIDT